MFIHPFAEHYRELCINWTLLCQLDLVNIIQSDTLQSFSSFYGTASCILALGKEYLVPLVILLLFDQ